MKNKLHPHIFELHFLMQGITFRCKSELLGGGFWKSAVLSQWQNFHWLLWNVTSPSEKNVSAVCGTEQLTCFEARHHAQLLSKVKWHLYICSSLGEMAYIWAMWW